MDVYQILTLMSLLVMLSYFLDLVAHKINIPSVMLLVATGIGIRQICDHFGYPIVNFDKIIPIIGNIGLILIVFEGALDLEVSRKKIRLTVWAFVSALVILVFTNLVLALIFHIVTIQDFYQCVLNALPFSIISSAIAIPSVMKLQQESKEFIIYESSFSDILGIILFNFFIINKDIQIGSFVNLGWNLLLLIFLAVVCSFVLTFVLSRLRHKIKFFLIIAILIFVFSLGKMFHLSTLLIILVFGLLLRNLHKFNFGIFNRYLKYDRYDEDFERMHQITYESAFLIKTFFFLIFGYIIDITELFKLEVFINGSLLFIGILFCRFVFLYVFSKNRDKIFPEVFISPRGLITVLLYFMIPDELKLPEVNMALLMFVVLSTNVTMILGIIASGGKPSVDEFNAVLIEHNFHEPLIDESEKDTVG